MNEKTKHGIYKKLTVLFVMTVLCTLFAVSASAETISGECGKQGDNVTWAFDTETGVLTIQGEGEMADYVKDDGSWSNSPWGNIDVQTIVVGNGVTSIGSAAFHGGFNNNSSLTTVYLPQTVDSIGVRAFEDCVQLQEIEMPNYLNRIDNRAFCGCSSLKSVYIPKNVNYIGEDAFLSCASLESIDVSSDNPTYSSDDHGVLFNKDKSVLIMYPQGNQKIEYKIPDPVKIIGKNAYMENQYIKKIIFNKNLEEIEYCAFRGCTYLIDVTFPNTLKKIGSRAFEYCWSFENIVLPESLETIEAGAFLNLFFESITIKGTNTKIEDMSLCCNEIKLSDDISREEFLDKYLEGFTCEDEEKKNVIAEELEQYLIYLDRLEYLGTIRCHAGSTAEAYAKENGVDCELVHFFGDWVYDWDNLVRSHECTVCGYTEAESLEKTESGGVEIIEPVDPDTEFIVEEITKNGDRYAVVEKTVSDNLKDNFTILKTFDITLKNKDGVHVQPDGIVKVKLPLDWDKDGDYKVYRVNDDGTLTDMDAYRQGSHMVFDADHFSVYVIVDESSAETDEEKNDSPISFLQKLIKMFKDLLSRIISFFQSIGDMT